MADKLHIAPKLRVDTDYVAGRSLGLLAKRGSGKSYLARVMAEEFWKAKVPFVLLDPMGTSWGLRSSADGDGEGIPVAIFGGERADAPLERGGGALLADLVVEEGLSMILDMSELGSRAAERQFALDFFDRIYRRNKDLVHLLIDEADLFMPQKPQAGDRQLLGVAENIVRRGRNKGIGCTLISQRPAVINKDVLNQVDGLIVMRLIGLSDRETIDKWVAGHGEDPEEAAKVKSTLASLKDGECWWWVPELGILKRVQVRRSRTFDSSPTKTRGAGKREPKSFADVDMGAIEQKMSATIERARAEDPKELRRRIRELEQGHDEKAEEKMKDLERALEEERAKAEPEVLEVPLLDDRARQAIEGIGELLGESFQRLVGDVDEAAGRTQQALTQVLEEQTRVRKAIEDLRRGTAPLVKPAPAPSPRQKSPPSTPTPRASNADNDGALTGPQQRVLDALAWLSAVGFEQPTKIQVGFIAGYRVSKKVGGTFANVLGQLHGAGLISYPRTNHAALTEGGVALAEPPAFEMTTEGMQAAVFARLNGPERRVLQTIIDVYPSAIPKQEAGERAGYTVGEKIGGTYANVLGKLRSLGLVDYPDRGMVRAEDILFLN